MYTIKVKGVVGGVDSTQRDFCQRHSSFSNSIRMSPVNLGHYTLPSWFSIEFSLSFVSGLSIVRSSPISN